MRRIGKKAIVLLSLVCAFALTITGCSKIKGTEVVMTVNSQKVTIDFINFYLRYNQAFEEAQYGSMFGDVSFWAMDFTGAGMSYEDSLKDSLLQEIATKLLLETHMGEYNVVLSDEEKASIAASAEQFLAENDATVQEKMTATTATVSRLLELYTIEKKMYDSITADVNTEVSDEEAAQKRISQVLISTAATNDAEGNSVVKTEEEIAALKQKAENILAEVQAGATLEAATMAIDETLTVNDSTFGADSTSTAAEIMTAVEGLENGEYAPLIETASGFYVVQLVSNLDREATDAQKETIISERKGEAYAAVVQPWVDEVEIDINTRNLSKISFQKDSFIIKQTETESAESTDLTTEEAQSTETLENTDGETEATGTTEASPESQTEDTGAVG